MDQIVKWAVVVAGLFVMGHVALVNFLDSSGDTIVARSDLKTEPSFEGRAPNPQRTNQQQAAYIEDPIPGRAVQIPVGRNGHFYLDARVNGATIPFVVDTGASSIALSYEAAQRAGFNLKKSDFIHSASTANGIVPMAIVNIDSIRYKGIHIRNVQAGVLPKGALGGSNLLGNSFLGRLQEYKVRNGTLIMIP